MKRFLILFATVWSICIPAYSQAAGYAGLTYEFYRGTGAQPSINPLVYPTVVSTGVSPTINYSGAWGGTNSVLNTGYWDRFIVRWYGFINVPTTGTYTFGASADDGVIVRINNTEIISGWYDSGGALRTGTPISLTAGTPVPIEIWYYENGGGQSITFWYLNNGSWTVVPTTMLATESTYFAPPPAPTAVYSSGITTTQQTRKTANQSQATGHNAQIDIAGDDNIVNVQQIGPAGHYVQVDITGNVNSVTVLQTSTTTARHYLETTITGSNNTANLAQRDTAKTAFVGINGNTNNVSVNQKDSGNHYLNLTVTGNNHTAAVIQEGSGSHAATVSLSGSQPWNFNLNQSGSTNKTYSLPHSMSDGSTVSGTCSAIGGCNLTVNQQ